MNNIINSSGIYDITAYNLTTNKATILSTLTIGDYIIGSGTALSNLNYGSITNPPDLTLYNGWTKISGTSNIYNTTLGNVGIGINNPLGTLEIAGYNGWAYKLKFGHINRWSTNQLFCTNYFRFLSTTDPIAYFGYVDSYDDPVNRTMVLEITRTNLNMTGNISATGNMISTVNLNIS